MGFWKTFLGFDPNRLRSFPGQQQGEEVVLMTVFHWMSLVPFFFYFFVIIIAYLSFYFISGVSNELSPLTLLYLNSVFIEFSKYSHYGIGGRDATILAFLKSYSILKLCTHDKSFKNIPDLTIIDPIPDDV